MHGRTWLARCTPLEADALLDVIRRARPRDQLEHYALTGELLLSNPDQAAGALMGSRWGAVIRDGAGEPQAALGALACPIPGVWTIWLHATAAWPEVWRTAYRWAREVLRPAMLASPDVRRAQALVVGCDPQAMRFARSGGLLDRETMRGLCVDGRDAAMLVRIKG
jgi:hypothetical protein